MQGQKSTVESLPEPFESGSTSSNPVMVDSPICWNDVLSNQNMVDYFLSPNEVSIPCANSANLNHASTSDWNFSNPSSSGQAIINQNCVIETRTLTNDTPLVENLDIDIDGSRNRSEQAPSINLDLNILENSYLNNAFQSSDHNAGLVGRSGSALGIDIRNDSGVRGSDAGIFPSSNISEITCVSSAYVDGMGDRDGRQTGSLDGRRLLCKRKNIQIGGSSQSTSSNYLQQSGSSSMQILSPHPNSASGLDILRPSNNHPVANPTAVLNPRVGSGMSGASTSRSAGTHRSARMRMTPAEQRDLPIPNLQPVNTSLGSHQMWPQPPSPYTPLYQTGMAVAMPSSLQSPPPVIPVFPYPSHHLVWNARPSSSSPLPSLLEEAFVSPREEANPARSLVSNGIPRPAIFVHGNAMHVVQDPVNWSRASSNESLHGNVASSQGVVSSTDPLVPYNLVPHRNPSNQYQLSLELVRRSIASAGSHSVGQGSSVQSRGSQASQQMVVPNRGIHIHGQSQPLLRLATLLERHSDAYIGDSLTPRMTNIRERRSRLLSEIRSIFGHLRRGDDLRFEAVFLGAAGMYDRHRDMRLDVDNMSYEELLALEERIGNVSTGLSEESIFKCLKQWKYSPPLGETSLDVEPCCICQEEYVEGNDMGTLDCGHEFHTICVIQWLMQKNLCPICKKAALAT